MELREPVVSLVERGAIRQHLALQARQVHAPVGHRDVGLGPRDQVVDVHGHGQGGVEDLFPVRVRGTRARQAVQAAGALPRVEEDLGPVIIFPVHDLLATIATPGQKRDLGRPPGSPTPFNTGVEPVPVLYSRYQLRHPII